MKFFFYRIYNLLFRVCRALGFASRRYLFSINPNVIIGKNTRISKGCTLKATDGGEIQLLEDVFLSKNVTIVAQSGKIVIGKNSFVGEFSTIVAKKSIEIGPDCLIAERVTIRDQNHNMNFKDKTINESGFNVGAIHVGDDVWICAGAVVLKGVTLHEGSVVAANAVVTRSVNQRNIVAGIPARKIGERNFLETGFD